MTTTKRSILILLGFGLLAAIVARPSTGASTQRRVGLLERCTAAANEPSRFAGPLGLFGVPQ